MTPDEKLDTPAGIINKIEYLSQIINNNEKVIEITKQKIKSNI